MEGVEGRGWRVIEGEEGGGGGWWIESRDAEAKANTCEQE